MFQMTVKNAIRIGDNISFGGPCENRNEFTNRLTDDFGNVYDVYIPLGKDLAISDSQITLCAKGIKDIDSIKGRVLKGL